MGIRATEITCLEAMMRNGLQHREFVTGCREATGSYKQNSKKAYSLHFGSNYPNSGAKAAYDQIVSLMSEHNTIPSLMWYKKS